MELSFSNESSQSDMPILFWKLINVDPMSMKECIGMSIARSKSREHTDTFHHKFSSRDLRFGMRKCRPIQDIPRYPIRYNVVQL